MNLLERYKNCRDYTQELCNDLSPEDMVLQLEEFTSPTKWHLGHTSWFFETIILNDIEGYISKYPDYGFLLNSYYELLGERIERSKRSFSQPSVYDIYDYRTYIDEQIEAVLNQKKPSQDLAKKIILGIKHEEQHQELLLMDIKYAFWKNPLKPAYNKEFPTHYRVNVNEMLTLPTGSFYFGGENHHNPFDNELPIHSQLLRGGGISGEVVSNGDYLGFILDGGYKNPAYWLSAGWDWVQKNNIQGPLYWETRDNKYKVFTLRGLEDLDINKPVTHISYYEADAYAKYKHMRLPTEFELEFAYASKLFEFSGVWEWSSSNYAPYPGYRPYSGAATEYNGKFMSGQYVLKGSSLLTPASHSSSSYRNFYNPADRWAMTGIRLCIDD